MYAFRVGFVLHHSLPLFSSCLCELLRGLCVIKAGLLGHVSYGTFTAAAGTATCPMVWLFKEKHLQGSYGEEVLLPFKCACAGGVHV